MKRSAPLLLVSLLSLHCGSAASDHYGHPLATLRGTITSRSTPVDKPVGVALVWQYHDGQRTLAVAQEVTVTPEFPARFTLEVMTPPPKEAMTALLSKAGENTGVQFASGTVVVYSDGNGNGKLDLVSADWQASGDQILGLPDHLGVIYFEGAPVPSGGLAYQPGFNLVDQASVAQAGGRLVDLSTDIAIAIGGFRMCDDGGFISSNSPCDSIVCGQPWRACVLGDSYGPTLAGQCSCGDFEPLPSPYAQCRDGVFISSNADCTDISCGPPYLPCTLGPSYGANLAGSCSCADYEPSPSPYAQCRDGIFISSSSDCSNITCDAVHHPCTLGPSYGANLAGQCSCADYVPSPSPYAQCADGLFISTSNDCSLIMCDPPGRPCTLGPSYGANLAGQCSCTL
jgi:hypothetical protein